MDILYKTTQELLQNLTSINSIEVLETYLKQLETLHQFVSISDYFNHIIQERNIKKATIINHSSLDRTYAYQILNGSKQASRNKLLALCFALPLSLKETQYALTINGNNILYAKNKRDALIIYAINTKQSLLDCNHQLYQNKLEIIE